VSEAGFQRTLPVDGPGAVLVVDDEVLIRMALSEYLRDCGYTVREAASAEEAQDVLLAGHHVDILFSDIRLPGQDGVALATWARANFPSVSVFLASGYVQAAQEAANLCNDLNLEGPVLTKPYDYQGLASQIRTALVKRGQASELPTV
jgi:CheY-like chemotaxis protein